MKSLGKSIGSISIGALAGLVIEECTIGQKRRATEKATADSLAKMQEFYELLLRWISVHQKGRKLSDYFKTNGYSSVAIYGMKELGEALQDEFRGSEIEVKYGIDRDANSIYSDIDVYRPEEAPDDVDIVVVTAIHYYDEIEDDLRARLSCKIVSLEDVIEEVVR